MTTTELPSHSPAEAEVQRGIARPAEAPMPPEFSEEAKQTHGFSEALLKDYGVTRLDTADDSRVLCSHDWVTPQGRTMRISRTGAVRNGAVSWSRYTTVMIADARFALTPDNFYLLGPHKLSGIDRHALLESVTTSMGEHAHEQRRHAILHGLQVLRDFAPDEDERSTQYGIPKAISMSYFTATYFDTELESRGRRTTVPSFYVIKGNVGQGSQYSLEFTVDGNWHVLGGNGSSKAFTPDKFAVIETHLVQSVQDKLLALVSKTNLPLASRMKFASALLQCRQGNPVRRRESGGWYDCPLPVESGPWKVTMGFGSDAIGHKIKVAIAHDDGVRLDGEVNVSRAGTVFDVPTVRPSNKIDKSVIHTVAEHALGSAVRQLVGELPQARSEGPLTERRPEFATAEHAALVLANTLTSRDKPRRIDRPGDHATHTREVTVHDAELYLDHRVQLYGATRPNGRFLPHYAEVIIPYLGEHGPQTFRLNLGEFVHEGRMPSGLFTSDDIFESLCRALLAEDSRRNPSPDKA